MKALRILGAVIGTVALVGMFSCGGSSYLSENPLLGEGLSSGTFTATGATYSSALSLTSKDYILGPVGGTTGGTGNSFLDDGLHYCFFEFGSDTLPDGDITIKSTAVECNGIVNCGYCEATQVGYPNCELSCFVNTAASNDLVGEYLEITYVDKAIMYSDAPESSGGALRIEGEALDPATGSHLFDSTSRAFTIVDGGLTLDQVTPLTDVLIQNKFDYSMAITDTILDPNASAHDLALPDNTAWVDIESRVTAQLPMDDLATPGNNASMEAGTYASNVGFWHDSSREVDILIFLDMFDPLVQGNDLSAAEADVSHACTSTEAQSDCHPTAAPGNSQCLGYLLKDATTAPGECTTVCIDYTGLFDPSADPPSNSTMADYILDHSLTDQTACEAANGNWFDVGGPFVCLPNQLADCMGGGGSGCPGYDVETDIVIVCDSGLHPTWDPPCDPAAEWLDTALSYVFDTAVEDPPNQTLRELYESCGSGELWLRAIPTSTTGPARTDGGDYAVCPVVADRFLDGGDLKNILVKVTDTHIKTVIGDDVGLDPFSMLDSVLLPDGINKNEFQDGDENWHYGLSARWNSLAANHLQVFTPDKSSYNGADSVTIFQDILRVKENSEKDCKTDPDPNDPYDYLIWITLKTPLNSATNGQVGTENCGEGNEGIGMFYEIVDADCVGLGDYNEVPDTYTNSPDGLGCTAGDCDEDLASARSHIFDLATDQVPSEDDYSTLRDYAAACGANNVKMRLFNSSAINQTTPDADACMAVAERFFVDATLPENQHVMQSNMSYSFTGGGTELVFSLGGENIFEDLTNDALVDTNFLTTWPGFEYGVNASGTPNMNIYATFPGLGDSVKGNAHISRVKVEETMPVKGDGIPYHYIIILGFEHPATGPYTGTLCGDGGASYSTMFFEVDGSCW